MNAVLTIPCDTKRRAIIIAHGAQTRQGGFCLGKGALQCPPRACLSGLGDRTSTFLPPERAPNKATGTQGHTLGLLQFII